MSIKSDYQVLGFGNPFCDRSAYVDDLFLEENKLEKGGNIITQDREAIDETWNSANKKTDHDFPWTLGGSGTNVVKALTHFGNSCALYGKIAEDSIGEKIAAHLKEIGVVSLLSKAESNTGIVNCFITPDKDKTMHAYLGACFEFSERDISIERFDKVEHVHFEGYTACFGTALETGIAFAQENKSKISLDLASPNIVEQYIHQFKKCVAKVDFVFGNAQEMQALTGMKDIKEAVESFGHFQTIVSTEGKEGCWVKAKGEAEAVHYDAIEVLDVKDTTGAGDYFDAGFIHGTLQGKKTKECVAMGNLAASFVIKEEGSELPNERWIELKNLILKV